MSKVNVKYTLTLDESVYALAYLAFEQEPIPDITQLEGKVKGIYVNDVIAIEMLLDNSLNGGWKLEVNIRELDTINREYGPWYRLKDENGVKDGVIERDTNEIPNEVFEIDWNNPLT